MMDHEHGDLIYTVLLSPNNYSSTAKNSSPINTLFTGVTEKPPKHFFYFRESHRQSKEVKKKCWETQKHIVGFDLLTGSVD